LQSFFSSDGPFLLQFLVIFLVILVLLMGAVLLFRRLSGRGLSLSAKAGQRGRQPRLGIVDIYELDRQRQLILLRRDNVEHLLLVGGPNDVVIERNIQRGAGARIGESMLRPEPAPDMAPHSTPNLAPPTDAPPESLEPPRQDQPLFAGPAFTLPADVPVPLPGSMPPPVRTRPLDQSLFEPEVSETPPPRTRVAASAAGRILRRTPPPLLHPRPDVASERTPTATSEVAPPSLALPAGETRTVDPAVLSDMARQLETALRRPSSAVTPPPGRPAAADRAPPPEPLAPEPLAPEPPASEPQTPEPPAPPTAEPAPAAAEAPASPPAPDPVAAAMAASQAPPPPAPPAQAPEPVSPAPSPAPPREPDAPVRVAPPPAAEPAAPPPRPAPPPPPLKLDPSPAPAPAPPAPASAPNPFSVEEIEAEFARLLGRPLDRRG